MRFIKDFKFISKYFGLVIAYKLVAIPRFSSHLGVKKEMYIPALLRWQRSLVHAIIEKYRAIPAKEADMPANNKIWTCWWQGKEQMPDVIKECHKSLLRNANGYEVVLITKYNFREYIELPNWIIEKMEDGKLSLSHFSDLVRLSLLNTYGGVWIDSALYLTRRYEAKSTLFMPKMAKPNMSICQGRWWFGVISCDKHYKLFEFIFECLLEYWKRYDTAIDYLMFDGFLRIAYEEFDDIRSAIDNLSVSSPNLHESRYSFDKSVDFDRLNYLIDNNDFLSLTWRINYPKVLPDGSLSYYGALLERFS